MKSKTLIVLTLVAIGATQPALAQQTGKKTAAGKATLGIWGDPHFESSKKNGIAIEKRAQFGKYIDFRSNFTSITRPFADGLMKANNGPNRIARASRN